MPKRYHSAKSAKHARLAQGSRSVKPRGRVGTHRVSRVQWSAVKPKTGKHSSGQVLGGYLNKHASFKHGRPMRVSQRFVNKVRMAATPPFYQQFTCVTPVQIPTGGCTYAWPIPTYQNVDIRQLAVTLSGSASFNNTYKYQVRGCKARYDVKNSSNVSVNLRVYECEPRFDIPYGYVSSSTVAAVNSINTIAYQGWIDGGDGSANSDFERTLYSNTGFTSRFKINSCREQKLVAGEQIRYEIIQPASHIINMERWLVNNGGTHFNSIYLAEGMSKFLVIQCWGGLVTESSNVNLIGTFGGNVSIFSTIQYEFGTVLPTATLIESINTTEDGAGDSQSPNTSFTTAETAIEQTGVVAAAIVV